MGTLKLLKQEFSRPCESVHTCNLHHLLNTGARLKNKKKNKKTKKQEKEIMFLLANYSRLVTGLLLWVLVQYYNGTIWYNITMVTTSVYFFTKEYGGGLR